MMTRAIALVVFAAPLVAQNHPQFPEMKLAEARFLLRAQVVDVDGDGFLDATAISQDPESVLVARGDGTGALAAPTQQGVDLQPRDLAWGDISGDGLPDAFVVCRQVHKLAVLLNGGGALLPATFHATGQYPWDVELGDLDNDGALDVFVACENDGIFLVFRSDGAGNLLAPVAFQGFAEPKFLALADYDEDGSLDAAVAEVSPFFLSLFLGDGSGGLHAPLNTGIAVTPTWMQVADVREDGHADIVLIGGTSQGVRVIVGDGQGELQLLPQAYPPGPTNGAIAGLGDKDGDGHLDLIVGGYDPKVMHEYTGDGSGAFQFEGIRPVSAAASFDMADMNRDGRIDLLVRGSGYDGLTIILGDPAGSWQQHVATPLPVDEPTWQSQSVAADFDGDDLPDLLATSDSAPIGLHHFRGLGDGSFAHAVVWQDPAPNGFLGALDVGDMDLDGLLDAIVCNTYSGAVRVLLGNGGTAFVLHDTEKAGVGPTAVAIGNLDEDGLPDVAVAVAAPNDELHIFFGEGEGSIALGGIKPLPGDGQDIVIAEATGDAFLDVVAGTRGIANRVAVFTGNGAGGLAGPVTWPVGGTFEALAVTDLEPDGAPDVVAALGNASNTGAIAILRGNGAGNLTPAVIVAAGDSVTAVDPGDFDGDGLVDLLTASPGNNVVELWEQDGLGGFLPRRPFGAQSALEVHAADANGDGVLDILYGGPSFVGALLNADGPVSVLGEGLSGSAGVPALAAISSFASGAPLSLRLQQAAPSAPATLLASVDFLGAPLKGGILVPNPDALVFLVTDAQGRVIIDTTWPDVPVPVYLQAWVADGAAPKGFAASRGLRILQP